MIEIAAGIIVVVFVFLTWPLILACAVLAIPLLLTMGGVVVIISSLRGSKEELVMGIAIGGALIAPAIFLVRFWYRDLYPSAPKPPTKKQLREQQKRYEEWKRAEALIDWGPGKEKAP